MSSVARLHWSVWKGRDAALSTSWPNYDEYIFFLWIFGGIFGPGVCESETECSDEEDNRAFSKVQWTTRRVENCWKATRRKEATRDEYYIIVDKYVMAVGGERGNISV